MPQQIDRRDALRFMLAGSATLPLAACQTVETTSIDSGVAPPKPSLTASDRKATAQREFQTGFVASGAAFRFPPHGAHGRPWTSELQAGYDAFNTDPRVAYAVQDLDRSHYLAEQNADEIMFGGSMPKPAVSATLLERRRGILTRDEYMHIVKVCDRSINASWKALLPLFNHSDEQTFEQKYALPDVGIRSNHQSPRFYSEFFQRAMNYRFDYGCELLLEAMRRAQFGRGRWYLPREITYVGGKTGTYGEWKHEGLFFRYRSRAYSIIIYTKGYFGSSANYWKIGALFGGLFREHIAQA